MQPSSSNSQQGLQRDEYHLRANSSKEDIEKRIWRTSHLAPFAGNVMVVLYKCEEDGKLNLLVLLTIKGPRSIV